VRRLIMWLCFVGMALATTSLAAVSVVCASGSVYLEVDGSGGWDIDWDARNVTEVPSSSIMADVLRHAKPMPLIDCSDGDIRCVSIDEKFDLKVFAITNGETGDTYRVAHWTFRVERQGTRQRTVDLKWVSFKDDDKGGYNGRFLYDSARGIVSITQEKDDGSSSTMVLVDGPGLLAPGLICPAAEN
jgi:hypothetical protein